MAYKSVEVLTSVYSSGEIRSCQGRVAGRRAAPKLSHQNSNGVCVSPGKICPQGNNILANSRRSRPELSLFLLELQGEISVTSGVGRCQSPIPFRCSGLL